jgi:hypothetical protein
MMTVLAATIDSVVCARRGAGAASAGPASVVIAAPATATPATAGQGFAHAFPPDFSCA